MILRKEKDETNIVLEFPLAGNLGNGYIYSAKPHDDGNSINQWVNIIGKQRATPKNSYYISCDKLPSVIRFGQTESDKNYCIIFENKDKWYECEQMNGKWLIKT